MQLFNIIIVCLIDYLLVISKHFITTVNLGGLFHHAYKALYLVPHTQVCETRHCWLLQSWLKRIGSVLVPSLIVSCLIIIVLNIRTLRVLKTTLFLHLLSKNSISIPCRQCPQFFIPFAKVFLPSYVRFFSASILSISYF